MLFTSGKMDHDEFEDKQYPDNDEYIPYVTGANLAQKKGSKVTLWGKVNEPPSTDGKTFYVNSIDDQRVCVKLEKALNEHPEGWYEIHGKVLGDNLLLCDEYVQFNSTMTENIDKEGHKSLAKLLSALDDPWDLGDVSSDNGVQPMTY